MNRCLYILLFLFVSCNSNGNSPFYFFPSEISDSPEFHFEYGKKDSQIHTNRSNQLLHYENGVLCVFSIPIQLYNKELGAKFRICWKMDEVSSVRWQNGFELLNLPQNEYSHFQEIGKDWKVSLTDYGKWKVSRDKNPPILEWKQQIWSTGHVSYQTFAIPHPTFIQKSNTVCEVVFRSFALHVTENKTKVIVFEFPCPNIDSILESVLTQNQSWLSNCKVESPIVSESFRHTESNFQRFLEWENPNEYVICLFADSLVRKKENEIIGFQSEEFRNRSRLVLPNGILLLSDDPKYQGIPIPKHFLAELGTEESISFGDSTFNDSQFFFKQGEEFFSNQIKTTSCRDQMNIWKTEQLFCGNPGLPNGMEKDEINATIPGCTENQIKLTEFYPGNHKETGFPLPSFFEFQNKGDVCDVSSLNWIYEGVTYPLSAKEKILLKDDVLVLTREPWIGWNLSETVKPFTIPKVVFQIPSHSIQNRKSKNTIQYEPSPNRIHLLRRGDQNLFSIYIDDIETPHPKSVCQKDLLSFGFQLSPGKHESTIVKQLASQLLEFAVTPFPFLDFGYSELEEGIGSFRTVATKEYFYWKPALTGVLSFGYGSSLCNGEKLYQLPPEFFSNHFNSVEYLDKDTSQIVLSQWTDSILTEKSHGDTRSLHPEPAPIYFSSSLRPSATCPGIWRSPGIGKQRSLEIIKANTEEKYHTNLFLDSLIEVQIGNVRQKQQINILPLSNKTFSLQLANVNLGIPEEQIYSYFSHPELVKSVGFLEKKGPVQIEAIFPNPIQSQNEWIYICNRSTNPEDLSEYSIEDETSIDLIVPYQTRFPNSNPKGIHGNGFITNDSILHPSTCAWIVDPDGKDWYLPIFHSESDRLLTVISTQTIGNGISSGEYLQLKKRVNGETILISAFGHKESANPFRKHVNTGEYLWLKKEKDGINIDHFEIYREEN